MEDRKLLKDGSLSEFIEYIVEPVQFGDEVEGCKGKVEGFRIFYDGSGTIFGEQDDVFEADAGVNFPEFEDPDRFFNIKHSEPEVHDADTFEKILSDFLNALLISQGLIDDKYQERYLSLFNRFTALKERDV